MKKVPVVTPAGIYARISQDRSGDELGVTRQRVDCEALVDREGWTTVEVYIDDDRSAYSSRDRPAYTRLLEDIAAGRIRAVVAWHPDRLHRSTRELEDFIDLVERTGAAIRTVTAGELDLSTPVGRMTARVVGAVSRHESEQKAARVSRKMQELAEAGKFTGGSRTFGYTTSFEPVDDEADAIREAARRLLAGESLNAVARYLNERGLTTTRGNSWSGHALRLTVTNPRLAALKVYRGEVIGDAPWPAIIDRTTHERLVGHLTPTRRRRPTRTRLLSGLLRCGRDGCHHPMIGQRTTQGAATYRCPNREGYSGCGRTSIVGRQTDDEVRDRLLARLAGPGLAAAVRTAVGDDARQQQLTGQLVADEAALEQLTRDHYVDRVIGRAEFLVGRQALEDRLETTRRQLKGNGRVAVLAALPADEARLREAWEAADLQWRRAVLGAVVDVVMILPAERKGQRWTPDRVVVKWKV